MGFEGKPDNIKAAVSAQNTEHLRAAGRKGAEAANAVKKRERERAEISELQSEIAAEERKLEDEAMRRSANEHIINTDGQDQNYSE